MFKYLIISLLFVSSGFGQTIKGKISESDTKHTISFANVVLTNNVKQYVTVSDTTGFFRFDNLATGRYNITVRCLGYQPTVLNEILVVSGKQTELQITLLPQIKALSEVVIRPEETLSPLSSHKIVIDQTNRYAGTWGDIARMAMSFAGVNSVNDQSNELIIRGNSPKGLLWMVEGIEVPNPNHFGSEGASGGALSIFNTTVLSNSIFYTGAFPSNYGNATSGVFDVRLRSGNNEKRESNVNISLLGIDVGTEGPLSKKRGSSYLFNYRFANTKLIQSTGLVKVLKTVTPKFQDMTLKLNFPFRKSNLSIWGIAGKSVAEFTLESFLQVDARANLWATGINYSTQISKKTTLESIISSSGNESVNNRIETYLSQTEAKIAELSYSNSRFANHLVTRINNHNLVKTGVILNRLSYDLFGSFDFTFTNPPIAASDKILNDKGHSYYAQAYFSWQKRWSKTTMIAGIHATHFVLNNYQTFEPRLSVSHQATNKTSVNFGLGSHSRLEAISVYLYRNNSLLNGKAVDNSQLGPAKSFHTVLGLTHIPNSNWRINTEVYHQYLFNIGVGDTTKMPGTGNISLLNQRDAVNLYPLISRGTGQNYGWELTVERSLNKGVYCLFTTSLFRSTYKGINTEEMPSRFDNRFVVNLLSGKEWKVGTDLLNINIKSTWAGGIRTFPFNMDNDDFGENTSNGYTDRLANFFRFDFKVNYTLNFKKTTSTFSLDINNLTNRSNPYLRIYNPVIKEMEIINQIGLLPVLNYRLNF